MTSILTNEIKTHFAKVFKEYIENTNNSVYLTIGNANWANDASPPTPLNCTGQYIAYWDNMVGGKKITGNDIYYAVPRYTWTANTEYAEYRHDASPGNNQIYVVTSDWNVYKCISNNYGAISTVEPTSVSTTNISNTADGYIWKFLYTLSVNERSRFMTDNVIPIKTLTLDDASLQWQVQNNAISGAIYHAYIQSGGTGYSNSSNIVVTIRGDGENATATAGINNISNVVNSITFTAYGTGYSYATATITGGGGSGANVIPIISPPAGHGKDPITELGATSLIINGKIQNSESGIISVNNQIAQVGIVVSPRKYSSTNLQSNSAFSQTLDVIMTNYGADYEEDEIVYQGTSYVNSTFSAKILHWDVANLRLRLINTKGSPTSDVLYGANSAAARFVMEIESNLDCEPYTGKLLYIENMSQISRAPNQTESFKITIDF